MWLSLGLTAFKWPLCKCLNLEIQHACELQWDKQAFCASILRVGRWPVDSSRNYRCSVPPRRAKCRCWKAAHPDKAPAASLHAGREQIICYISLLARTYLHLLLFFFFNFPSKLMLLGSSSISQDGFFHWERSRKRGPLHMVKAWGLVDLF